jgi:hypothetical protein
VIAKMEENSVISGDDCDEIVNRQSAGHIQDENIDADGNNNVVDNDENPILDDIDQDDKDSLILSLRRQLAAEKKKNKSNLLGFVSY